MRTHCRENLQGVSGGRVTVLNGASVSVFQTGTTTPILGTIWQQPTGANTYSNPLTAQADGTVEFYLDTAQTVDLFCSKVGFTSKTVSVDVMLPMEGNLIDNPTITGTLTGTPTWASGQTMPGITLTANGAHIIGNSWVQGGTFIVGGIGGAVSGAKGIIIDNNAQSITAFPASGTNATLTLAGGGLAEKVLVLSDLVAQRGSSGVFSAGPNGATNPCFQVDGSGGGGAAVTGLKVKGQVAGSGVNVSTQGGNADETLFVDAEGAGSISLNSLATGAVLVGHGLTVTGTTTLTGNEAITGTLTVTSASASSFAVGRQGATNPALVVDSSAGTQVNGLSIAGSSSLNQVVVGTQGSDAGIQLRLQPKGGQGVYVVTTDAFTVETAAGSGTVFSASGTGNKDVTVTSGNLVFGAAASQIVPGATSFSLRNTANNADNFILTDAGAATFRSTVGGITTLSATTVTATNLGGTLSTAAQGNVTSLGTLTGLTDSGNLAFTGTGNRITGDFSNGTVSNRVFFQSSTVNGNTVLGIMPNGSSRISGLNLYSTNDPANASITQLQATSNSLVISSAAVGTGTVQPIVVLMNGATQMTFPTAGGVQVAKYLAATAITALATTGTVSVDPTVGNVLTVTPTGAITFNAASVNAGQDLHFIVTTSGASSFVLTFGTNFKSTGTLATGTTTGKVFVVSFTSDGTNYNETSRTTAM